MAAWECGLCYLGWNSFEEYREHTKRRHPETWAAYVKNLGQEPKNGEHAIELELDYDNRDDCKNCHGTGLDTNNLFDHATDACSVCNGTGKESE